MGRLAEHVEGVPVTTLLVGGCAVQRFGDAAPHDELPPEYAHTLGDGLANHGIAEPAHQASEHGFQRLIPVFVQGHDPSREHQCPGRRIDENRFAVADVFLPVRRPQFVADQAIRCLLIGNAQQRFGETHEHDAFLTG